MREIAAELDLSHQRVHQIVGADVRPARRRHERGLFLRFTRGARAVVSGAVEEARALGHDRVGTEHLLLGAASAQEGDAARILANAGVELERLRGAVSDALGPATERHRKRPPFTRAAKRALEQALVEAGRLHSRSIGSEHVLLGLLATEECGALALLSKLGTDTAVLRNVVLTALAD